MDAVATQRTNELPVPTMPPDPEALARDAAFREAVARAVCPHCGSRAEPGSRDFPFCCTGCREVYALLDEEGLGRWYDLAGGQGVPVSGGGTRERSWAWLEPLLAETEKGPICRLDLDVQGVHCAACVWLMNELYAREGGRGGITVNPALGKVRLTWERGHFDVARFLGAVERFGYRFGPSRKRGEETKRSWPLRIGICAALTMNVMLFSASFYVGLAPTDGELFELFTILTVVLSTAVVAIGGWPFFKSAYEGLRRGVLHLDLPIAAGILLAFGTSLVKVRDGRGDLAYFDTVDAFVTLMLVGRWLQERMLDRNRRLLLDEGGADGIHVRREEERRLTVIKAPEVREGDRLVIAPGDLVPVDATLESDAAEISTDWINGESEPRLVAKGDAIPAGSFNASRQALRVTATKGFADSPLPELLRAGAGGGLRPPYARLIEQISRVYVPVVLTLAAAALWWWWPAGPDKALDVTVAVLVVTCPCALGLATPLAAELALAHLRRQGVFVRAGDLLDRLLRVRKVLFDKTGTVTLGRLELADPAALERLEPVAREALAEMAFRSNHPASKCLAEELSRRGVPTSPDTVVVEKPGLGLELVRGGVTWRLGRATWAAPRASVPDGAPVLARDGEFVATFATRESMRPDAQAEIARLQQGGLEVWLVSGDAPEKVAAAAEALGVPREQALAAQRPEDKAAAVARLDHGNALFVGDGVNDSLAFAAATATGTPAVDRPVMPGKADFFLLGDGLGGIRSLFVTAKGLRRAAERTLLFALFYNVLAVAASFAGLMTPLRAALFMPLSTVTVLALTAWSLSPPRLSAAAGARLAGGAQEKRR